MFATFKCRDGIEDYHLIASTCILIHLINKGVIRLGFRSSYIPTRQRKPRCSTERTSIYSLHITVTFTLSINMDDTSTSIVGRFAEEITRYDRCWAAKEIREIILFVFHFWNIIFGKLIYVNGLVSYFTSSN